VRGTLQPDPAQRATDRGDHGARSYADQQHDHDQLDQAESLT
jgi:hypothetical protein